MALGGDMCGVPSVISDFIRCWARRDTAVDDLKRVPFSVIHVMNVNVLNQES